MPCYSPVQAYQVLATGEVVFAETKLKGDYRELSIACGQCHGCRLERSRQWATRCIHESRMHERNCFDTLTYSPENLPADGSLHHEHVQKFLKRLRHHAKKEVRYYMCGEYGETNPETNQVDGGLYRPHYHICLFGWDWQDKEFYTKNSQGDSIYISRRLDEIWGLGQCTTAELNFRTAAYTARYIMQKRTGKTADAWYQLWGKTEPEYNEMSRRPGIGKEFMLKYADDIYNHDKIIINGKEAKPPKYYDEQLKRLHPWAWQDISEQREMDAYERRADNLPHRLKAKEIVSKAALQMLRRDKI